MHEREHVDFFFGEARRAEWRWCDLADRSRGGVEAVGGREARGETSGDGGLGRGFRREGGGVSP